MAPPSSKTGATAANAKLDNPRASKKSSTLNTLFVVIVVVFVMVSFGMAAIGSPSSTANSPIIHNALADFKKMPSKVRKRKKKERDDDQHHSRLEKKATAKKDASALSEIGELICDDHGGPSKELAAEMIYWKDIPSDASWVSPFKKPNRRQFLTFEPDGGGWNNIRMAMESTFGLALAMGRTLVMPPEKKMYLLGKGDNKQKQHFNFVDFFPIDELVKEHIGFEVISMQEYLETQAMTGQLRHKDTGEVEFPPGNRTDWDGIGQKEYDILRGYLRNVTVTPLWKPGDCLPAFPESGDHKDVLKLQEMIKEAKKKLPNGSPVAVDETNTLLRLEENLAGRKKLCVYDETMQSAPGLHFQCNHKQKIRMLVHFYAFLFFEDWKEDLFMKRFIRDHVRYIDEIQCAAARVVAKVREHARKHNPDGNPNGIFDSFHIRRGDFQFKATRIPAEEIYENSKAELTPNTTIFVATDERDKSFFRPLKEHYDILFLDDFKDEIKGLNTNYYGMVDQLVASKGRIFFGCWFSTFTGYITRIRGYHSQNQRSLGYENGTLPTSYYYATIDRKFELHEFNPLRGGFFNREFPTSWRDIDKGIGQVQKGGVGVSIQ